jgi:hypothetical protein
VGEDPSNDEGRVVFARVATFERVATRPLLLVMLSRPEHSGNRAPDETMTRFTWSLASLGEAKAAKDSGCEQFRVAPKQR